MLSGILLAAVMLPLTGCSHRKKEPTRAIVHQVRINEVMSVNTYYAPLPDGSCGDWVELYNASDEAVNLKGCMFSDSARLGNRWQVPTDWILEPKTYGILYLSGLDKVDEEGHFHTNFKLSSKGETLVLSNALGDVVQMLKVPSCTLRNISYGYDGRGYGWFAVPSPGASNGVGSAPTIKELKLPATGLRLSEYMTKNTGAVHDGCDRYSDWVEIHNTSDKDIPLYGIALSDSGGGSDKWFFPQDAVIKAGAYMTVFCTDAPSEQKGVYHADLGLREGDKLTLYSIQGTVIDETDVAALDPNISCGRALSGKGWRLFAEPTPGRANLTKPFALTEKVEAVTHQPLYISEVLCVSAKDGDYATDFIELHNASDKELSLEGYALAKSHEGERFVFPAVKLPADGYVTVYCTGKRSAKNGHYTAPFKLGRSGETVYLFDENGYVTDLLTVGRQQYGHSTGRQEEKNSTTVLFDTPTPDKANPKKAYTGYAPQPVFSSDGGYVEAGYEVLLSAPEGFTVRYTTDGSLPNAKSPVYSEPIVIGKTTVIRAASFAKGYLPSEAAYATFFVGEQHTLPVVSLSSPPDGLFSKKTGIMASTVGQLVKNKPNFESNQKRPATVEYFVDGKKAVSFETGVKLFGEGSRNFPQKALALVLGEAYGADNCTFPFFGEYGVKTFDALLLRPSGQDWKLAHLRDEYCARLVRDSSITCDYQEAQPVALYINGAYWGLYYIREKQNEDYLVNKYGWQKGSIDIIKKGQIVQAGSDKAWTELIAYCKNNDLSKKKHYDYVCSQVDIQSLMDWWVFETYVANNDAANERVYRNPEDGKWHWMLFDLDVCLQLEFYKNNYIKLYATST